MKLLVLLAALAGSATLQAPGAQISEDVKRQDLKALDRVTGGAYQFEKDGAKNSISGQRALALLKDCNAHVINEPNDGTSPYGPDGHVLWVCASQPSDDKHCLDVGYGGIIRATGNGYILWLARNDV